MLDHRRRFELLAQLQRSAAEQGQQRHPLAEYESKLQRQQRALAGGEPELGVDHVELPREAVMRKHDALGLAGRAGGEEDIGSASEQRSRARRRAPRRDRRVGTERDRRGQTGVHVDEEPRAGSPRRGRRPPPRCWCDEPAPRRPRRARSRRDRRGREPDWRRRAGPVRPARSRSCGGFRPSRPRCSRSPGSPAFPRRR